MRSSKIVRLVFWVGCVLLVVNIGFFIYPSRNTNPLSGFEPDPNAPVVLVADDVNHEPSRTQKPDPNDKFPPLRLQLKPGSLAKNFLVFSYDHGGGGLVSDSVFNIYGDDVFFLYQPLYKLGKGDYQQPKKILGDKKGLDGVGWLQHIYNCSFAQHPQRLHEPYLWKSKAILSTYNKYCHTNNMSVDIAECIDRACKERGLRGAYTVTFPPSYLTNLIQQYGDTFKIVVVIRDPRAILGARQRTYQQTVNLQLKGSQLCTIMAQTVYEAHQLNSRYPGSIEVIHYEHLVLEPHKVLSHLYNFLGFDVSNQQLSSVIKILKLNHPEELRLQMTKMWQVEMSLQESRLVDRGCLSYYPMLGYLQVPRTLIYRSTLFHSWDETLLLNPSL